MMTRIGSRQKIKSKVKPVQPLRQREPETLHGGRGSVFRTILWFAVAVFAAFLQTTWPDSFKFQGVLPDLPLLLVVYFGLADGEERAMYTGVIGGIYQDVACGGVLGHHVLCLAIAGYLAGRFSTRLVVDHPAVKAGVVFVGGLLNGGLYVLVDYVTDPVKGFLYPLFTSAVPAAFFTAIITPVVFWALAFLFHRGDALRGGRV